MSDQLSTAAAYAISQGHASFKQLEAYVDNLLAPELRAMVDSHLRTCPDCVREVKDLTVLRKDIKAPHIQLMTRGRLFAVGAAAVGLIVVYGGFRLLKQSSEVPAEYTDLVTRSLAEGSIQIPRDILSLGGALPAQRFSDIPTFRLRGPLSTAVLSTKPEFSWDAVPDKAKYTVSIFDENHDRVDHSGPIAETTWRPTVALREGAVYEWQVKAETISTNFMAPGQQNRKARFRILSRQESEPLSRVAFLGRGDHLLLGVVYAQAGVLDEAESELSLAGSKAAPLLADLRNSRPR